MNILSPYDSKRAYRDYLFYMKNEICECEEKITLSNVVAVEDESTMVYKCSMHCAEKLCETVNE